MRIFLSVVKRRRLIAFPIWDVRPGSPEVWLWGRLKIFCYSIAVCWCCPLETWNMLLPRSPVRMQTFLVVKQTGNPKCLLSHKDLGNWRQLLFRGTPSQLLPSLWPKHQGKFPQVWPLWFLCFQPVGLHFWLIFTRIASEEPRAVCSGSMQQPRQLLPALSWLQAGDSTHSCVWADPEILLPSMFLPALRSCRPW